MSVGSHSVTIVVGPDKKSLTVDRTILRSGAKVFYKALNGELEESKAATLELPEDDPKAFRIFLLWAAGGQNQARLPLWNGIDAYDVLKISNLLKSTRYGPYRKSATTFWRIKGDVCSITLPSTPSTRSGPWLEARSFDLQYSFDTWEAWKTSYLWW